MARSRVFGGVSVLSDSLATGATEVTNPLSLIPAGFGCIAQFSSHMLQRALSFQMARSGLSMLSARVPYQAELVAPQLRAAIGALLTPLDFARAAIHVEVLLLSPRLQTLRSSSPPPPHSTPLGGGVSSTVPGEHVRPRRVVDLSWSLQVNLFKAQLGEGGLAPAADLGSTGSPTGSGTFPGSHVAPVVDLSGGVFSTGLAPVAELPKGDRVTVAGGTVLMHVPTDLVIFPNALLFWLSLNFEGVQPVYRSDESIMEEFLETELAAGMLAQAVAPALGRSVPVSPTIALAGNLAPSHVISMQLPALNVRDLVVQDEAGEVLSLCVSLGDDSTGVLSDSTGISGVLRSFLEGRHFGYYLSESLYRPILKARWRANAVRTPIVGEVTVEMPLDSDSTETGEGKARLKVSLSDTLREGSLRASENYRFGDPLRLVSENTIQLLRLWYANGDEVEDLGDLGVPATLPLALSVQMFDRRPRNVEQELQPVLKSLLDAVTRQFYLPMLERFAIKDVSGYTSSARRAFVVRWNLQSPRDSIVSQPTGGILARP